jgi:hypothetical protein
MCCRNMQGEWSTRDVKCLESPRDACGCAQQVNDDYEISISCCASTQMSHVTCVSSEGNDKPLTGDSDGDYIYTLCFAPLAFLRLPRMLSSSGVD